MKTVRFAQLVARSGRPHVHTLWTSPDADPEFSRARKANRVLTIETPASGRADVGHVGFASRSTGHAQYLIFPKSLQTFADARVVGVKFDLVDQPPTTGASVSGHGARRSTGRRTATARSSFTSSSADAPAASKREAASPAPRAPRHPTPARTAAHAPPHWPAHRVPSSGNPALVSPPAPEPTPPARAQVRPPARPPTRASRSTRPLPAAAPARSAPAASDPLRQAVRVALRDLRAGRTVAAYQRLERALGDSPGTARR